MQYKAAAVLLALGLTAVLLLPASARTQEPSANAAQEGVGQGIPYEVEITGAPEDTEDLLRSVSRTVSLAEDPPATLLLLQRRAEDDLPGLKKALQSRGFIAATVSAVVRSAETPVEVVFVVEPGPAFRTKTVEVLRLENVAEAGPLKLDEDLPLRPGDIYSSEAVVEAGEQVLGFLRNRGHPFARMADRSVVADHADASVSVTFRVDPGPSAVFGATGFRGLERVDQDYAAELLLWKEGESYDASLVEQTREKLFETGLFSYVEVEKGDLGPDARLPLTVALTERKPRTVKAGLEYSTDFGLGMSFGWEHRNIAGEGERLATELSLNERIKNLSGSLTKPRFLDEDQSLALLAEAAQERTEAYTVERVEASGNIERELIEHLSGTVGLGYRFAELEEKAEDQTTTNGHLYLPASLLWDSRDDLLNPVEGVVAGAWGAPYWDTLGEEGGFYKYRLNGSTYLAMPWTDREDRLVLALRGAFGQILGPDRRKIPADLRFYTGGGGSVRGYAYQTAGDLADGEPVGGKSFVEVSSELRLRITERFGIVPFLDGGRYYRGAEPDTDEDLFWGAGLGLRWFTGFGPLRIDVAVPLERREDQDDAFQVYASIGQAF
jgi:translocation and assembly module TamA